MELDVGPLREHRLQINKAQRISSTYRPYCDIPQLSVVGTAERHGGRGCRRSEMCDRDEVRWLKDNMNPSAGQWQRDLDAKALIAGGVPLLMANDSDAD
jgi:hypothetical protein